MDCQLGSRCLQFSKQKRAGRTTAGGVLRKRLLCSTCGNVFCRKECKDAHSCDSKEVYNSVRHDAASLQALNDIEKQQWQARKATKRARTEPKLSIGPGDADVVSLGLALLALLDPGQRYDAAFAMLDRLEAASDGLDVNAGLATAQCATCKVKLDMCCYKVPEDEALTGDMRCSQCHSRSQSSRDLVRLVDAVELSKLRLFLTELRRVVPNPAEAPCVGIGEDVPTIVPGFCVMREGVNSSSFTASQLVAELGCFGASELAGAIRKVESLTEDDPTSADCAKRVLHLVRRSEYLSFNAVVRNGTASCLSALNAQLRKGECRTGARGVTDAATSTLLLVGDGKGGTRFHVDWSEAKNVAFALQLRPGVPAQHQPLALWVFVHPSAAAAAGAWLAANVEALADGFQTEDPKRLEVKHAVAMQQALGTGADGTWLVRLVYQHAGDMVVVPAGWIHTVVNIQPCLKLAFDIYRPSHFPAYLQSWRQVASVVTGSSNAPDYMGVVTVLLQAITGFVDAQLLARG